jgi:hypothetical protein
MYIEDYIELKRNPPKREGAPLDVEYTVLSRGNKAEVFQRKVGTVFIGPESECRQYISQQRTKQAIKKAERGMNPFFTR